MPAPQSEEAPKNPGRPRPAAEPRRVLLLETVSEERHHHLRAEFFPLFLGLLREAGWDAQWWTMALTVAPGADDGGFLFSLSSEHRQLLGERLSGFRPDIVVVHNRPDDEARRFLLGDAAARRLVDLTEGGSSGPSGPDLAAAPLQPTATPSELWTALLGRHEPDAAPGQEPVGLDVLPLRYDRTLLTPLTEPMRAEPLRLLVEPCCPYGRGLSGNPFYAELPDPTAKKHRGCAFCGKGGGPRSPDAVTLSIERTLRQVEAHQASDWPRGERAAYFFEDGVFSSHLPELLQAAMRRGLSPCVFTTMVRADLLLAQQERLSSVLPEARRAGHALHLTSIGAENFSPDENDRLNKGLSAEVLWRCVDLVRDFEERFPTTFACVDAGYFSTILFTPWTTPRDLLENTRAARELGTHFLNRAVGTRLQLTSGLPITALAAREGLLSAEGAPPGESPHARLGECGFDDFPWRFRDERTRRIQEILVRLAPSPEQVRLPAGEPLAGRVRALQAALPSPGPHDYVATVEAIVEAVRALGAGADLEAIFAHAGGHLRPSAESPAQRRRSLRLARQDDAPPAPAPEPGAPPASLPPSLRTVLDRFARAASLPGAYALTEYGFAATEGPPALHVSFAGPAGTFEIVLCERSPAQTAWLTGERFEINHIGPLPADHRVERRIARALLIAVERAP